MKRKREFMTLAIAVLCGLLVRPMPAQAALVIIGIEGIVDDVQDPDNYLEGRINIGDLITGSYTYDTDTPDSNPLPSVGDYEHYAYPCGFSLSIGGYGFVTDPGNTNFLIEIVDDGSDDFYMVRSYNNLPLSNGTSVNDITWHLNYNYEDALFSTELAPIPPVPADWEINFLSIGGGPADRVGFSFSGHVTSAFVIPEPATILLLGFAGLIFSRRGKE